MLEEQKTFGEPERGPSNYVVETNDRRETLSTVSIQGTAGNWQLDRGSLHRASRDRQIHEVYLSRLELPTKAT
ncbi:hypothetical protein K0M31_011934 [Melipona bicolor]|uniref:Uncharacterized protein n=1 Tax=Melipona bicolor TaxID=60889 RepID=A0AA40KV94_9HYME|nr:hypothetical protein K0M31_011934 [Melipona bicolor]